MKRILTFGTLLIVTTAAVPAHAAGSLHTWNILTYINDALLPLVRLIDSFLPEGLRAAENGISHVIMFTFVCLFLAVSGAVIGASYRKKLETGDIAPSPDFSFSNFMETVIGMVLSLINEIIGHDAKRYLPLIGSLALVILFNNCAGLLPGLSLSTSNLNTTAALALSVFFSYQFFGIQTQGLGKHLEHFMGPLQGGLKYAMAPIMIPIELISHLARPMSLSLRLFGNMFGDHTIFGVFMVGLGISLPLIFPLPFLALGLLVCIVQTLVFCLLSMVYIALATEKAH